MKLEIRNVNKSFDNTQILHDVSFDVVNGKAMGFLGRNGAGKTTTIRVLMNVFNADSGEILIDGKPFERSDYKIGYLPEVRGMYDKINVIDQLIYFGELKGMTSKDARDAAMDGLNRMELEEYANKKLQTLSKGNQQKVQILQAILNDPDIVIFDEPFSGLDPVNSQVLKDIIVEFIEKDRIVIFSSHQMSHVEEFCDDVTFIKKGKIILHGDLEKIKAEKGKNTYVLGTNTENVIEKLKSLDGVIDVNTKKNKLLINVTDQYDSNILLRNILDSGIRVDIFEPFRPNLEEIFIDLDKEF